MSQTIVHFPKITQAMDDGWCFVLFKGAMGTYCVVARGNAKQMEMRRLLCDPDDGELITDDFTPEQALTRAAYKCVDGVII